MVHLTRIYTKFGDAGQTMLGDGSVVPKTSPRVSAYGAVDETNAALGLAVCECDSNNPAQRTIHSLLISLQQDLFDVGADLCTPITPADQSKPRLRVTPAYAERLEKQIDFYNAALQPLQTFVLPGGTRLAAALHLARTIARRAELAALTLTDAEPAATNRNALIYLNRLRSDLLFVLARCANDNGRRDLLWTPGANRNP